MDAGQCWCDSICQDFVDCCRDAVALCSGMLLLVHLMFIFRLIVRILKSLVNVVHFSLDLHNETFVFFIMFGGHQSFLWCQCFLCFGLLDVCPCFQSQGQLLTYMCVSSPTYNESSDSTLVQHLLMFWEPVTAIDPFQSIYLCMNIGRT